MAVKQQSAAAIILEGEISGEAGAFVLRAIPVMSHSVM
jgi:hypothetical protein